MPELAAHLERVAREVESAIDHWCETGGQSVIELMNDLRPIVAAALAACAREARNEALWDAAETARRTPFRCHAKDDVDFHSGCVQTQERIVDAVRKLGVLERAAGEKASLDPQRGQHDT